MSNPVSLAVILAAGSGTRLRNIVKDIPKGFLRIGQEPIIEESVKKLLDSGIKRIIVVTGFLDDFYNSLADKYPCIKTKKNESYADSGSMYSLYCARNEIKEDFLLLESDLIYENRALKVLQEFPKNNCILLSGETKSGDEVYVEVIDGKVKDLSKDRNKIGSLGGELVGISRISKPLLNKMLEESEVLFKKSLKLEYDTGCISCLAKKTNIYSKKVEDLLWAEIDDENHLRRAIEEVYPKIIQRDRASTINSG